MFNVSYQARVNANGTALCSMWLGAGLAANRWNGSRGALGLLDELQADLALMTGHVAQFFLEDEDWHPALVAIRKALRPGGHIAFESRNPLVQPWADQEIGNHVDWPTRTSRRRVDDPVAGRIEWWTEILEIEDDRVRTAIHYHFTDMNPARGFPEYGFVSPSFACTHVKS